MLKNNNIQYCPDFSYDRWTYTRSNVMHDFHCHDAYELFFLESGPHCFITEDRVLNMSTYDVALFKPMQLHRSKNNFPYSRICLYFTEKFMDKYFKSFAVDTLMRCFDHNIISLGEDAFAEAMKAINKIRREDAREPDNRIFLYLAEILHILYENRFKSPIRINDNRNNITKIINYICNNYNKISSIDDIAEHFYLSKYHLCRTFKEKTGFTLVNYINSVRIQNACEKLLNSNAAVTEIAIECGFNSCAYFCQIFKKNTGYTPNDFRTIYDPAAKRQLLK